MSEADRKRVETAATLTGALAAGVNPLLKGGVFKQGLGRAPSRLMGRTSASLSFTEVEPFMRSIDRPSAVEVVSSDPFLTPIEREGINGIIMNTPSSDGKLSQFDMMKSALKATGAFVPSYLFGRMAGQAVGLPKPAAKAMSGAGALALAVRASGLLKHLETKTW